MMGAKNPLVIVAGLLILLAALGFYQWTLMTENALLKQEGALARASTNKLRQERDGAKSQLAELSMSLDDRKRYISDIDGKFLRVNAELESKGKALQQCNGEKKKMGEGAEKQKNDLKTMEDQLKKMEQEKKKVQTDLEEYKKLCDLLEKGKENELTKKLCSTPAAVVQSQ